MDNFLDYSTKNIGEAEKEKLKLNFMNLCMSDVKDYDQATVLLVHDDDRETITEKPTW